jgi:hypothetical protein
MANGNPGEMGQGIRGRFFTEIEEVTGEGEIFRARKGRAYVNFRAAYHLRVSFRLQSSGGPNNRIPNSDGDPGTGAFDNYAFAGAGIPAAAG